MVVKHMLNTRAGISNRLNPVYSYRVIIPSYLDSDFFYYLETSTKVITTEQGSMFSVHFGRLGLALSQTPKQLLVIIDRTIV